MTNPLTRLAFWTLIEALPAFATGVLVAVALDRGFTAGRPVAGVGWLTLLLATQVIGAFATGRTYVHLANVLEPLRDALMARVVRDRLRAPASSAMPDQAVVARLTDQIESVRQLTATLLKSVRPSATSAVAGLIGVATLAPILLPLIVLPVVAFGLAYTFLLRRVADRHRDNLAAGERLATATATMLAARRDTRACGAEASARETVGTAVDDSAIAAVRLARTGTLRAALAGVGGYLPLLALVGAVPWLISRGMTPGEITGAALATVLTLQPAMLSLAQLAGTVGIQLKVTRARLPALEIAKPLSGGRKIHDLDLSVRAASAGYPGGDVLRRLDLDITGGEHLVILGPSGAGKSTLVGVLAGLIPPREGEVRLGGVPLSAIDPAELRRTVAVIPQEAYVHEGTLRENITYLAPAVALHRLEEATFLFGLAPVAQRWGGLDAAAGSRLIASLSAGERQRIALARVWLSPARIVMLDEATCHLGPAEEAAAERAFAARPGTLIVVAHRVSSAERAGRVLTLSNLPEAADTAPSSR